jgi:hypothetical protein
LRDRRAGAGIKNGLTYKAARNKPLRHWQTRLNMGVAAIRAAVEPADRCSRRGDDAEQQERAAVNGRGDVAGPWRSGVGHVSTPSFDILAHSAGFEPATSASGGQRSIH